MSQSTIKKVLVSELEGAQLDWAVAVSLGHQPRIQKNMYGEAHHIEIIDWNKPGTLVNGSRFEPHKDWNHGGRIIEREQIHIEPQRGRGSAPALWWALCVNLPHEGPTPLIAAMRAFVASKLGNIVEVQK
jgi:hypothetical protein